MKEIDKKRSPNKVQSKRSGRTERRTDKQQQETTVKKVNGEQIDSRSSNAESDSSVTVSDSNTGSEPSEVYEDMVIHYVDDVNRFEDVLLNTKPQEMVDKEDLVDVHEKSPEIVDKEEIYESNGHAKTQGMVETAEKDNGMDDLKPQVIVGEVDNKSSKEGIREEAESEPIDESLSSQGDPQTAEDETTESTSRVPKRVSRKDVSHGSVRASRVKYNAGAKPQTKASKDSYKKPIKSPNGPPKTPSRSTIINNPKLMDVPPTSPSESTEGVDDQPLQEEEEEHGPDEVSNGAQAVSTDDEAPNAEDKCDKERSAALGQRIEEMESKIEKLEEELREVAALEISLYSVVPEHGSSSHKVHTPARRLSRIYIHACKHWTQNKRATVAKNTVSGLVLIAKSCGNDVPRLTFWLSNIVVLREIICQAFGSSCLSSPVTRLPELKGSNRGGDGKSPTLKWKSGTGIKQVNDMQFAEDWQETRTLTTALEKVETWIFSRIVESVWWQSLTPNMQSPLENSNSKKTSERVLGPALGDKHQGSFSINLWRNAFHDAFQRLCPLRAGGHECGCLPVLGRLVMEQCVARLDVAMFNAILRESAHEIPTDPVSDPILDPKVLPIPAGDLSFGSGAQLKNSVGNWSRWLTDLLGMDADDYHNEDQHSGENDDRQNGITEPESFHLLNTLSDLLMLPKDMLIDQSIRKEVCPSITLPLIKRILCNFTPDEFCPDAVPGAVLEALNAESIVERKLSGDSPSEFPYPAAPVVYAPPSSTDVAEKVAEAGAKSQLARNVSIIQKKGYTSDEELEELDFPLITVTSPTGKEVNGNATMHKDQAGYAGMNARYALLREVWSV